ncbi:MAG: hypothetical protein FWH54_06760 [Methanobrevibacter sp.]|nr:hypothetical protein [Methanobrevibacter sp.]
MTFFFDTNVCIGYIFRWEPWHEKAKNLFNKNELSYWSDTVKDECANILQKLVQEYIIFLNNTKDKITDSKKNSFLMNDFLNIVKDIPIRLNYDGKEIIDKFKVIYDIFEDEMWYDVSQHDLVIYLDKLSLNFRIRSFLKFRKCEEKLMLHPKTSNHDDTKKLFINNKIHYPDWQICLDAHDLGLTICDLIFVTADHKLCLYLDPILYKTNIKSILKLDRLSIFT